MKLTSPWSELHPEGWDSIPSGIPLHRDAVKPTSTRSELHPEGWDNSPAGVSLHRDAVKPTPPRSETHPEGRDKRQPAALEPGSSKRGVGVPVVELQSTNRMDSRNWDKQEHKVVSPGQRAQGNSARTGALPLQSGGLQPEGEQLVCKEASQNLIISPESPGEDPYMSDEERIKSSSSTGSVR